MRWDTYVRMLKASREKTKRTALKHYAIIGLEQRYCDFRTVPLRWKNRGADLETECADRKIGKTISEHPVVCNMRARSERKACKLGNT